MELGLIVELVRPFELTIVYVIVLVLLRINAAKYIIKDSELRVPRHRDIREIDFYTPGPGQQAFRRVIWFGRVGGALVILRFLASWLL
jgi:hypothetical protein